MQLGRYLAIAIVSVGLVTFSVHADEKKNPPKPDPKSCEGGYAPQFRLGGAVQNPKTFRYRDLDRYFPSRFTFSFVSGGTAGPPRTYIGVPLLDLLNEAVVVTDPNRQRNDFLRKYIVATGTDCYEAIIAYADLLPNFGGQQVFIAFETGDGQPLDATEGMARLFIIRDFRGGRHVSNVKSITVRSAP
jgi:Oxidoreductase molybdopterin binding domain